MLSTAPTRRATSACSVAWQRTNVALFPCHCSFAAAICGPVAPSGGTNTAGFGGFPMVLCLAIVSTWPQGGQGQDDDDEEFEEDL